MWRLLYHRDFFHARICVYCFFVAYAFALFFLDPFSYECSDANPCLGCGFRTGVMLLLQGRVAEGLESNVFVAPAMLAAVLALCDVLMGARWRYVCSVRFKGPSRHVVWSSHRIRKSTGP